MTFAEISKEVLSIPGIENGFLTHCYELRRDPKSTRTSGGGWNGAHDWQQRYRVVLYMEREIETKPGAPGNGRAKGGMAEAESEDLLAAIREALAVLGLPLPAHLEAR